MIRARLSSSLLVAACALLASPALSAPIPSHPSGMSPEALRGFDLLLNRAYTPPVLSEAELARLWEVWDPESRAAAEAASPEERRRLVFRRYGFIERDFDDTGLPLGYSGDGQGGLATNCLVCHGGSVAGRTIPGAGNAHQDQQALYEDLGRLRAKDAGTPDLWRRFDPSRGVRLNATRGVTNAFPVSVALTTLRDTEMNLTFPHALGRWVDHDEDAPAWWTYARKSRIYWTGFATASPRALMQFVMTPTNTGEMLRAAEPEFEYISAYIKSLRAPAWPFEIDRDLAARGRDAFEVSCAGCHGTYGDDLDPGPNADVNWPEKVVPLEEVGTDPVRLTALPAEWVEFANRSWLTHHGEKPWDPAPKGYLAQPLDGIWASAPYFHNGSVPTLWHVLHPADRPAVWMRDPDPAVYDRARVGLSVESRESVPEGLSGIALRDWHDAARKGSGAGGHLFPDELSEEEKLAVLEYLKTL